ncbi:MAG: response regulator transcription factor [Dorea sp.]|nr:response regulator transcription factor [Dorea sp.]
MIIGIIEDDRLLSKSLEILLQKDGYQIICMHTRQEAKECLKGTEALLIIDIGLPDGNGIELYQYLHKKGAAKKIPAIFLTARDEEQDMLNAFNAGADDYVVKPFSMNVLLKRIEVVLKRNGLNICKEETFRCGEIVLNPRKKQVLLKNKEILLTAKEYKLLEYFMQNVGQVLTKENIMEHIWGIDGQYVVDNNVSVLVNRLRKKIELNGENEYIKNVFGLGYRMEEIK